MHVYVCVCVWARERVSPCVCMFVCVCMCVCVHLLHHFHVLVIYAACEYKAFECLCMRVYMNACVQNVSINAHVIKFVHDIIYDGIYRPTYSTKYIHTVMYTITVIYFYTVILCAYLGLLYTCAIELL